MNFHFFVALLFLVTAAVVQETNHRKHQQSQGQKIPNGSMKNVIVVTVTVNVAKEVNVVKDHEKKPGHVIRYLDITKDLQNKQLNLK